MTRARPRTAAVGPETANVGVGVQKTHLQHRFLEKFKLVGHRIRGCGGCELLRGAHIEISGTDGDAIETGRFKEHSPCQPITKFGSILQVRF